MTKKLLITVGSIGSIIALFTLWNFTVQQRVVMFDNNQHSNMATNTIPLEGDEQTAGPKRRKNATTASSTTATSTQASSSPAIAAPTNTSKTMAWIYPGKPACSASAEMADGRTIHTLKAEYFTINSGALSRIDASSYCNGYSAANVSLLKKYSTEQYVTVSSASASTMATFLSTDTTVAIDTLTSFVVDNNLTGIELDFEDFGGWNAETYSQFKAFVTKLGNELHAHNKKLMIDGPAVSNTTEQNWYVWRYADFVQLPVDHLVIMAYDYQFDHGAGQPIAPLDWMRAVFTFIGNQYPKEKLVAGLPSYGYQGTIGTYRSIILTREQLATKAGFSTAKRDTRSAELTWTSGTTVYFYQDTTSLNTKAAVAREVGIPAVSVWHLGGNPWF